MQAPGTGVIPLRKKAHADSGTLTILAREAATEGGAGGLQAEAYTCSHFSST